MSGPGALPVHAVVDAAGLARAVAACRQVELVALDTEFMRVRTFYAQAALFQLCDGRACYLVDPLAVADLAPLAELLADPDVTKLMHSCGEDLEVCERRLGVLPEPLLDTQVMAAFCGLGLSVGYQRALAELLGIALEKSETRTDWLQRPLSQAQVLYAAEDVAHLQELHACLLARLAAHPGRMDWVREECAAMLARARSRDGADWRGLGGAWRLEPRALAALRAVHAWRERTARERDLPRSWIVPDAALLQLAESQPRGGDVLAGLPPGAQRRFGPGLLAALDEALQLPAADWPVPIPPPPSAAESRVVKSLRDLVTRHGEQLGLAPELLARRRELEEIVRCAASGSSPDALAPMRGWRREAIGEQLWRHAAGVVS